MIRLHKYILAIIFLLIASFSFGNETQAQDSQILSVTPPLFQLSVAPDDIWQSSIKVVNGNNYPLTVYAEVVNFSATGEGGQGKFVPILNPDPDGPTLAHWIEVSSGPHTIPAEQTKDIPFFVEVPENAAPGGHYAAILISTETKKDNQTTALLTSQAVTSLFFIKIDGEIEEVGSIREFSIVDSFLEKPKVDISLRFENKGNVHLQPRGDITISNMWGAERGKIPVNYQTHFGNVLPETIRDFRFQWESEFKITDVGRYTAEVVLTYGEEGMKSETAKAYFWVIPVKATLITLLIIGMFIALIVLMIKAYIRKMLTLAGVKPNHNEQSVDRILEYEDETIEEYTHTPVIAPLKLGVLDLRKQLNGVEETFDALKTVAAFVVDYKKFFLSIAGLIIIFVVSVMYISNATDEDRDYTISVEEDGISTVLEQTSLEE